MFRQILESKVMYIFVQEIPTALDLWNPVSTVMTLALNELSQRVLRGTAVSAMEDGTFGSQTIYIPR